MLYGQVEVDISSRHLGKLLRRLQGDLCLLGGWATYHLVNEAFHRRTGRSYVGSLDIDLGFHLDTSWSVDQLAESDLSKAMAVIREMGFWPLGFRFAKEFHAETGAELPPEEAKRHPMQDLFQLFVDPIVDAVHPDFRRAFGFHPIDEPLLSLVFSDRRVERRQVVEQSVQVPEVPVLLAMKLNSAPSRHREHKRVKDIADIYALLWHSGVAVREVRMNLLEILPQDRVRSVVRGITPREIAEVSAGIGVPEAEVRRVLLELAGP